MPEVISIKKGFDIRLLGEAAIQLQKAIPSVYYAIKPSDFRSIKPKLLINQGDVVLAGSPLFCDKTKPELLVTSPVSGIIHDIVRGDRRVIQEIVIKSDEIINYQQFDVNDIDTKQKVIALLLRSGLWPLIRQRPFNIIAKPDETPKAIFISGFDTAPLAPDYDFILRGKLHEFQKGIDVLKLLTHGKIHLGVNGSRLLSDVYSAVQGVEIHYFKGPHPAGNVGVQIHHTDPVNKGEVVWVINPQDVAMIGRFFLTGKTDYTRIIALTGSQVIKPAYYEIITGMHVKSLVENNIAGENNRYISGNVLTGNRIEIIGFTGFYDNQLTVIPEGNLPEFLGWALPGLKKLSLSRTFFSWLTPQKKYKLNTNMHGEERAFVMTGQYEEVLPMDIYPVFLLKAILAEDIEKMEQLGIYEVVEEDMALCEFACTSKIEVQQILKKGIELMIQEMN